jgi:hypothetical protein
MEELDRKTPYSPLMVLSISACACFERFLLLVDRSEIGIEEEGAQPLPIAE